MALVALEITHRQPLADGRACGAVGPYEQLDGTAHFAVDPTHPGNQCITDLHLASRDAHDLVHCAADVRLLTPVDPHRGNHRLVFDVPNRGNRLALWMFNRASRPAQPSAPLDPGDGFLMRHGYTIVWCGWQPDVPAVDGLMRIHVPEAQSADGPLSGKLLVQLQPNAPSQVQRLSDRLHRPSPTSALHDPDAMLLVRETEEAPPQMILRTAWSFARLDAGQVVPDTSPICLASGFVPGKVYQVLYTTTGAPVIGLGLLTPRELIAFLRYGTAQEGNPCAGALHSASAFGARRSVGDTCANSSIWASMKTNRRVWRA